MGQLTPGKQEVLEERRDEMRDDKQDRRDEMRDDKQDRREEKRDRKD